MKVTLSFILLLFFLQSCKDKDTQTACEKEPETCQYLSEAKDFFAFKVGSWWVYEEETTNERDSVYVTSANNSTNQSFNTYIFSARDSFYTHYFPADFYADNGCSYPGPVNKRCLYIRKTKYKFQNHLGETTCMFFKYSLNDYQFITSGSQNNKIYISTLMNNFNLGSNNFNNLIEITEDYSSQEFGQKVKFLYSKNIGLVKKTLIDSNETWNLVSYHIAP